MRGGREEGGRDKEGSNMREDEVAEKREGQ